jgi:hypothetical protein
MTPVQQQFAREIARSWPWESLLEVPAFLGSVGCALDDLFSTHWLARAGVVLGFAMGVALVILQRCREADREQRSS